MMDIVKYRKKPVVIEAVQLNKQNVAEVANWCGGTIKPLVELGGLAEAVSIKTLEGYMLARPGDYVIKGVAGEFYPCKPDIFEKTYEIAQGWGPNNG